MDNVQHCSALRSRSRDWMISFILVFNSCPPHSRLLNLTAVILTSEACLSISPHLAPRLNTRLANTLVLLE